METTANPPTPAPSKASSQLVVQLRLMLSLNENHRLDAERELANMPRAEKENLIATALGLLEPIQTKLLDEGNTKIVVKIISLIVSSSDPAGIELAQNCTRLLELLKNSIECLWYCPDLDNAAIECLSLLAIAVGQRRFLADSSQVILIIFGRFSSLLSSASDPFPGHFISIISTMGVESFLPFFPEVMRDIMRAMRNCPDFHDHHGTEKLNSLKAASVLAAGLSILLGAAFLPYVKDVAELAIVQLTIKEFERYRKQPAKLFPALLKCVKIHGDSQLVDKLWSEYWRAVWNMLEPGKGYVITSMYLISISECMEYVNKISVEERREIEKVIVMEREGMESRKIEGNPKSQIDMDDFELIPAEVSNDNDLIASLATVENAIKKY